MLGVYPTLSFRAAKTARNAPLKTHEPRTFDEDPSRSAALGMTQPSIFNPQLDYSLKVTVTYLPTDGGPGLEALITVPANSVAFADNSLSEIFNINGSGALIVATFPEDNPNVPDNVVDRAFL